MQNLLTKEDARLFFGLDTKEATEKLLRRLGVPRINFALVGGKGVRYRRSDLEDALGKITVDPQQSSKPRKARRPAADVFDLPVKEAVAVLTARGIPQ